MPSRMGDTTFDYDDHHADGDADDDEAPKPQNAGCQNLENCVHRSAGIQRLENGECQNL